MSKGFGQLVLTPKQERESKILKKSVLNHFQQLPDPRTGPRRDHNLVDIITIAILAVLCGADGFVAIETYGKAKQEWLETFLDLPYGIPSHDTFGRVFGRLDPQELQNSFLGWVNSISEKLGVSLIHTSRIRQGHAAENLGLLRRLSINLLKREPSRLSLKMKRYQAGINNDFLLKILAASAAE